MSRLEIGAPADDAVVMRASLLTSGVAAVLLAGCPTTNSPRDGGPPDAALPDAGPPVARGLDLLFLIDDSCPMAEEQVNLVAELPRLVQALRTGDADGDGTPELSPVPSVHMGFVTSDMGAGPHDGVPTCGRGLGRDGILRSSSRLTVAPCAASYPSGVFAFAPSDAEDEVSATLGCVANVGTGGCGFEQQLEASLKAVTPSAARDWTADGYVPPRFVSADGSLYGDLGQADRANAGFLRPDTALAIVLLTDEDDCSVRDHGIFVTGDPRFRSTPLNLRCQSFGAPQLGVVQPVSRYVDGFVGLRRDPRLVVFEAIVGIPPGTDGVAPDFEAILGHPNMQIVPNDMGTNVNPSCSTSNGVAYPPVRIVEVARGLSERGANVSLSSICSSSFEPALDRLLAQLATIFPPR